MLNLQGLCYLLARLCFAPISRLPKRTSVGQKLNENILSVDEKDITIGFSESISCSSLENSKACRNIGSPSVIYYGTLFRYALCYLKY